MKAPPPKSDGPEDVPKCDLPAAPEAPEAKRVPLVTLAPNYDWKPILVPLAFLVAGFVLGRLTVSPPPPHLHVVPGVDRSMYERHVR